MSAPRSNALVSVWRCAPGRHLPVKGNPIFPMCAISARPDVFDWRYLATRDVLAVVRIGADGRRVRALLRELVAVRLRRLIVLQPGGTPAVQFIVSAARGWEMQP